MNLRHVNSVSQSYIGNTALRYTPNKDGLLKARVPVPAAGEPPLLPAPSHSAGGLGEELGKICSEQGVFPQGPSRAEGKGGTLPEHGPALCRRAVPIPKESRVATGLPKPTAKEEKPKRTKTLPQNPPKKPKPDAKINASLK